MAGVEPRATPTLPGSIPDAGRVPSTFRTRNRSSTNTGRGKLDDQEAKEVQNQRALEVLDRVKDKLTGNDFGGGKEELSVDKQVDKLIHEATNLENLCQHYIGWCSFW
jgi:FKBP12-rapamycin complex-associated protein